MTCTVCLNIVDGAINYSTYQSEKAKNKANGTHIKGLIKVLPCDHAFHRDCIAPWLKQCKSLNHDVTCPTCRFVVSKKDPAKAFRSLDTPQPEPVLVRIPLAALVQLAIENEALQNERANAIASRQRMSLEAYYYLFAALLIGGMPED